MQETYIIASGTNPVELLRSLAANGAPQFNTRVLNPLALAQDALARQGHFSDTELLTTAQAEALLYACMPDDGYFNAHYFSDAQAVYASLTRLRHLLVEDEPEQIRAVLSQSMFTAKAEALWTLYQRYMEACAARPGRDGVMLLREALRQCTPYPGAQWLTLCHAPLSPLEQALVQHLSAGEVQETDMEALLDLPDGSALRHEVTPAYGAANEVEHILSQILREEAPLDHCVVAVTQSNTYSQLFYDLSLQHGIPVTFGTGVPIANANPAKLLSLLHKWDTDGLHGGDALSALVYSEAFDRACLYDNLALPKSSGEAPATVSLPAVLQLAGDLQLSTDTEANARKIGALRESLESYRGPASQEAEVLAYAEALFAEFSKGYRAIISEYSRIRPGHLHQGKLDRSALRVITEALRVFEEQGLEQDIPAQVPQLLGRSVSSENSREGFLHITTLEGALCTLRPALYVGGMGAAQFPGRAMEDPVLLDVDYRPLAESVGAGKLPLSENLLLEKQAALTALMKLYAALKRPVRLSYSSFDTVELKEENPSSALFTLYEQQNAKADFSVFVRELEARECGYFELPLSPSHLAGRRYLETAGQTAVDEAVQADWLEQVTSQKRRFSPTAIEAYFSCPRLFLYQNLLGLGTQEEDDPYEWMSPLHRGTLAHELMEQVHAGDAGLEAFMRQVDAALDYWQARRIPARSVAADRSDFRHMMQIAYEADPGYAVAAVEQGLEARHPSGITLAGRPDRVECLPDGGHIVVDYKTGRRITHQPQDVSSCLQAMLYAYMLEQNGFSPRHCEYRYLPFADQGSNGVVPCAYSPENKATLDAMLDTFSRALEEGVFPVTEDDADCRYCAMKSLCGGVS